jgi:hypothetical protein
VVLFIINSTVFMPSTAEVPWREAVLPFYGIAMLSCGLAAGIVGLMAVIRRHERSWLVWITILPGLLVLFLVLGEFLVPHYGPSVVFTEQRHPADALRRSRMPRVLLEMAR